jgi:hypothetical protein
MIDRQALVERHTVRLSAPAPDHVLTVGNGDFAFTADITGMQTFGAFHDQGAEMRRAASTASDPTYAVANSAPVVSLATMSNWGWHEMPNPDQFTLDDAMSEYSTARGMVQYPDRYDMAAAMTGEMPEQYRAGTWLHENPQRLNLGRIGLRLRATTDAEPETDPAALQNPSQQLDLWRGTITSDFRYAGHPMRVTTLAAPDRSTVAFRIESPLLADGRAQVEIEFPYASTSFFLTSDWDATERHQSVLEPRESGALIHRTLDDTAYAVAVDASAGSVTAGERPHLFLVTVNTDVLELVVAFTDGPVPSAAAFEEIRAGSERSWERFWRSGAALDLSKTTDPRACELERRAVLSQYLTAVNGAGVLPPQETGLTTSSWQGKFHVEMHIWHAAHFATWGRPELLERSLHWYVSTLGSAKATAARQGYPGARWPKQVGPDGRESPTPIGALLAWQQPHVLYLLELVWRAASADHRDELVDTYAEVVDETAAFMAAFPEERDGVLHLGPPIMPAQEFYDATTTQDPTFELAYWWWGLDIAQRWRERSGRIRHGDWDRIMDSLAMPHQVDGVYRTVRDDGSQRRDDHPAALCALGLVPKTPLIEPTVMATTLQDVLADWDWKSAWGWDFPMMAMTATRLGQPDKAVDILLWDESRNNCNTVGHNPQMGAALPLYLPGNGALLASLSLLAAGADDGTLAGFPENWSVQTEGFHPWP